MSHDHHANNEQSHAPHAHAPGPAITLASARSLLRTSASVRLIGAGALIACVWLAVLGVMA